jgi:hypothetical protein
MHVLKINGIFTQTIHFVGRMHCVQNMLSYGILSHLVVERSKSFYFNRGHPIVFELEVKKCLKLPSKQNNSV